MAFDIDIIELAFSIQFSSWRLELESFTCCSVVYGTLGYLQIDGGKEPRNSLSIAAMFGLLLLTEGVHPNPGPIYDGRLNKTFERILGGSDRAESPSFISFQKCLAQVSRDAEMTRRSPGDGMNTPPPEPKPQDGTTQDETGGTCCSTTEDVGMDTRADHIRSPPVTRSDGTSVDTPVVPHEDRVYPDSDADDVDGCVIPSVSAKSLNINDFIAESRLQSRTASNLNDDFYTNSERSSVAEERAETSVDTPVVPHEDRVYPNSDADDVDDCVIPSVSANLLNINDFIAESRLQSRTASNLNDDFYTNSERSSVVEGQAETSVDTPLAPPEDRVYPDSDADDVDDCVIPSVSANSLNINDFIAESRLQSRTASNLNDDFYTNSERSSVAEERAETSVDTPVVRHEDRVYPVSDADDVDDCVIPSVSANSLNINDFIAESRLQSRTASNLNDDFYTNSERSSVVEGQAETSVDTPVAPHEDRVYPDSDADDVDDCVIPSVSATLLNINDFIAESRLQSRTASNLNDDFYTNSERSSVMEERDVTCPGDGMNTPPPEAKPPDGTNRNETGGTCYSTTEDVGMDTRADHIRSQRVTRSDVTSVDTPVVPHEDRVYPDSDADDVDGFVIPSVSANSLNINDFIAESRLQSRTASNLNDDFYTNSERSSVAEERAETSVDTPDVPHEDRVYPESDADDVDDCVMPYVSADSLNINDFIAESRLQSRTASNLNDDFYTNSERSSVVEGQAETSVDTPVVPHEDRVYPDSDADDVDDCVIPSVSANSLNIHDFFADSRLQSRTASNLNDDFYTNSERSSVMEERDVTCPGDGMNTPPPEAKPPDPTNQNETGSTGHSTTDDVGVDTRADHIRSPHITRSGITSMDTSVVPHENRVYQDSDADDVDDCVIPIVSANSLNINDFIAESRLQSRTASNLNDDFYTNSERSSVVEGQAETSVDTPVVPHEDRVYPDSDADDVDDCVIPSVSANSLNINDFIAESRLQSRTASNLNDDFYTNSERSSVMEERDVTCPGDGMNTPPPEAKQPDGINQNETGSTCHSTTDDVGVDTRANHNRSQHITRSDITSVDASVVPHEDRVYPDSDADDVDNCVIPSVSANSLNINDFIAESRLQSRTASNLYDDFYTNSERSSVVEGQAKTSVDRPVVPHEDRVYPDSDADDVDDYVIPSVSANSLNINDFIAESRLQSRTASNLNDDFYTNSERSSVMEERDVTCPGDGMNTLPPEAKPPDGTNQDETGSTCHSTTDDVGVDTRADHIRPPHITRSDITSVDNSVVPHKDRVYPDSDADDVDDCDIPSVPANSLNIKDFIAESRLQSRTASNLNDDFYTNSERSSVAEERAETNEDTPVVPHKDRVYPDSDADDVGECVIPPVSANSLNINAFIAESRLHSRTASNLNDDFYTNSERSSVVEGQAETSVDTPVVPPEDRVYPDSDADDVDDCVIPSLSANSLNINDFIAESRLQSRTTSNLNDDFYTNSERSSVAEERAETSVDTDACDVDGGVIPSVSANSLNIKDFIAESRLQSRTASNLNDDFYTNSKCSSVMEERDVICPGEGMNTPPPEAKPPDGTNQNETGSTCHSTTDDVSVDTRADHIRSPHITRSDITSVDTPVVPHEDHVYPDSDADDVDDCVIPSVSANSLNDFIAESRLQSRTASNLNDDFYTNSESSSVAEERPEASVVTPVIPREDRVYRDSHAGDVDDCVIPSVSANSPNINDFIAESRLQSRTASNLNDDFYTNSERSSVAEGRAETSVDTSIVPHEDRVYPDSDADDVDDCVIPSVSANSLNINDFIAESCLQSTVAEERVETSVDTSVVPHEDRVYPDSDADHVDDCVRPSVSASSLNIKDFIAESRLQSRTASNLNDDIYTNSERSSVAEERAEASEDTPVVPHEDHVYPYSDADDVDNCVIPSVSANSLNINDFIAESRLQSRTASNLNDDFYTNSERSSVAEERAETSVDTPVVPHEDRVYPDSDADDVDDCVIPSVSANSLNINDFIAESRLQSRTASNLNDDFYTNSERLSVAEERAETRWQMTGQTTEIVSDSVGTSGNNEKPERTDGMRMTEETEGTESGVEDDHCVLPSATNMDDDFFCNDSSYSDDEDNNCVRIDDQICITVEKMSAEAMGDTEGPKRSPTPCITSKADDTDCETEFGESARPSASGDSIDINTIYAQTRAVSRTTADMDDDFYCNDEEENGYASETVKKKSVTFASSETITREEKISKSGIDRAATPFPYSSTVNRQFGKVCVDSTMDNSHIDESTWRKSVRFSVADRVVEGAENNEGSIKNSSTDANGDKFKSLLQRIIGRNSVIPSTSEAAADVLKNCRTDSPFLFARNDDVFMKSDDEGENDVENENLSTTRNISDALSDITEEALLTSRKRDTSDIEAGLSFTQSVHDEDDNTLEAFYHTSHTDISLTGKLKEINDRAISRMRTPCALLGLLSDQRNATETIENSAEVPGRSDSETDFYKNILKGTRVHGVPHAGKPSASYTPVVATEAAGPSGRTSSKGSLITSPASQECLSETPVYGSSTNLVVKTTNSSLCDSQSNKSQPTKKKNEKSRKGKGSKRAKEELGAVNRLSPTAMFTTPVLGPIKSDRNSPLMADRQMNRRLRGHLEKTPSVHDDDDNTLEAFYHTSPTDIALTGKLREINDRANSRMMTPCSLLHLLSEDQGHASFALESSSDVFVLDIGDAVGKEEEETFQSPRSQPTKKKNKKKIKVKGSKRTKEELGAVNRLSPTSMFTAPVLGPIKRDRNSPLMDDIQINRSITEQLEETTSVQYDGDNTLQAFYHTSHTDIGLTEKINQKNDKEHSRMRTSCSFFDLFSDQSQPTKKKNEKKKKGKGSKTVKKELRAVNRLSPTSMFTAPLLGPIKSDRNSPLMTDRQMNRSLIEQLEETKSEQDDDDNTVQAFYHTSHTDIALTEKINQKDHRANSRMRTSCSVLNLPSDQGQPTKKKNEKKRKGKGSKGSKEELGTVNRLSPTSMFTAPLLGPIKCDRNDPLMADRQMDRCLTEQLEETTSEQDDGDNTLKAFYHTSHTDIALTGKIKQKNDREQSRMRTSCSVLDLLSDQGQPTKKKKNGKRRQVKGSTRAKEELGVVNRLSPTSMFTAPLLGPIKSDRNNPLMDDRQMKSCLTEQLEKTTPVTDGDTLRNDSFSQPAKKNKKTKEPKQKKEELKSTSIFTAPVLGPIKSDQNITLTADRQTNSKLTKKSKNEKEQKGVKEELRAVNRLSPTSMFTAPILGPIKSNQNNPIIVNKEANRPSGSIDNGFIATPMQAGETSEVKTEENILQKAVTKLWKNGDEPGQNLAEKDATPVSGCLQTRSLTVAKFRAQFNRTCILLPEIGTNHKRDKQRQDKLKKHQAKMVQLNKRAALLVNRQRQSEEKVVNDNIDNGVIVTPASVNKMDRAEENILQKAFTELGDNGDNIGQHLVEKDAVPVSGCLQTRSLTVAKFRTQFNRTCILLPEIDSTHKKDKQRQKTFKEFQAKMVQINKTATLLVDMQQESEEKAVNDNIDNGVIVTPTSASEMDRTDGNILQKAFTELGDNGDHIGQHLVEKDATPVSRCLQTRSLTVAKFRTQLNRTCVLLPEKGEKQSESQLEYADIQSREEHRQKKLTEFQAKIDKINSKANLLLDMQNEPKENAVNNPEAFTKSDIQYHDPDELTGFKEITNEQNKLSSGKDITENQTTFTPHAPTGSKPSFVRRRRKFRQMSVDEQQKLKLRIANNEILVPKPPNEQKSNNSSNQVSKPTRRNLK